MQYAVLIMDVVKSRGYSKEKRQVLQDLIGYSLEYLNELFSDQLVKDVTFSGGDEIQGLFRSCGGAFLYCRHLSLIAGKGVFRGGIGRGGWDVKMEDALSVSQDGEAYHRARKAINAAHKDRAYGIRFELGNSAGEGLTVLADHSLGLMDMRTDSQNDIAFFQEVLSPMTMTIEPGIRDRTMTCILEARGHLSEMEKRSRGRSIDSHMMLSEIGTRRPIPVLLIEPGHRFLFSFIPESAYDFVNELSYVMKKSRQSVEGQIKRAHIRQERNAAAFFVQYCEINGL